MISYKRLYGKLFRDITQIIFEHENDSPEIIEKLKQSQIEAEEMYLDMCEEAFPNGEDLGRDYDDEEFDDETFKK